MYYVYILRCADSSYYTGITNRLQHRLDMHNKGKASHYTASRRPVAIIYKEEQPDKSAALKREYQIKQLSREEKIALVKSGQ